MSDQKLRPRATGLIVAIWLVQALIALGWMVSSNVEGASLWVWPFGAAWATFGVFMALRAQRQWVATDAVGIEVQSAFRARWALPWSDIADITPDPPGPLVTNLAVVRRNGQVAETPLAKGDDRLSQIWASRSTDQHSTPPGR